MQPLARNLIRLPLALALFASLAACALGEDRFLITTSEGYASGSLRDIALSTDGKYLAAAGEKVVRVWKVDTGTLLAEIRNYQLAPHLKLGRANAVTFSPDSRELVIGISDNTEAGSTIRYSMRALESSRGSLLKGHTACSDRVAFSRDGQFIASYG